MKRIFILYLFTTVQSLYAQNDAARDSLVKVLATVKQDSTGVELYLKAGSAFENSDPVKAASYYRMARVISEKINYKKGLAKSIIYYSSVKNITGEYDSGIYYNQKALELSRLEKDTFFIGITLFNIGTAYQQMSKPEEALPYFLEGVKLIEKNNNPQSKSVQVQMASSLQSLYNDRAQYDQSIFYGEKAILPAKELNDKSSLCLILINLSISYREKKVLPKAEELAKEALQIAKEQKDIRAESAALLAIAGIWEKQGVEYKKILPYAARSLLLSRESGAADMELTALSAVAICYLQQGEFMKAESFAGEALLLSQKLKIKVKESEVLTILSRIAYASGKLDEGARFTLKSEALMAEYVRETLSQQSSNLEKKYETEKKERQLIQQQATITKKNTLNYILIGSAATLLIISLLSYRNYRQKQKLQEQKITELEKEKLLLATQSIVKGQEDERSRLAKDLHDGLGGLLSGVKLQLGAMKGNLILSEEHGRTFNHALSKLDESISEMRRVAHNMMPEALMKLGLQQALQDYCDGMSASQPFKINGEFYGLEKRMASSVEIVVYRIVQELLNNAVKHSGATIILAQVMRNDDSLSITVEDNGKGFNKETVQQGVGLKNIRSRVDYLKGQLDIKTTEGKGTSVHIDCIIDNNG